MKFKFSKKEISKIISALLLIFPGLSKIEGVNEYLPFLLNFDSSSSFGLGAVEISAGLMLFYKKLAVIAAGAGVLLFSGGVLAHINQLGFQDEMAMLFSISVIGLISSLVVFWNLKKELPVIGRFV